MSEKKASFLRAHHIQSLGEGTSFKCPHCRREIIIYLKSLEGHPDFIELYWGKDWEEIEEKQKKLEEEK